MSIVHCIVILYRLLVHCQLADPFPGKDLPSHEGNQQLLWLLGSSLPQKREAAEISQNCVGVGTTVIQFTFTITITALTFLVFAPGS